VRAVESGEPGERLAATRLRRDVGAADQRERIGGRGDVEHAVADRDTDACTCTRPSAAARVHEHAEGQVLDRKVAAFRVGRLDPTAPLTVVRLVECHRLNRP
jgi:hypothetical protein